MVEIVGRANGDATGVVVGDVALGKTGPDGLP
jgi:hypothetical protein